MNRTLRIVFETLVLALAAWQVFDVGAAMFQRVGAQLDIEWMEGATLITGLRASEGLPFYTVPGPDYVPFIYPPLYAWVLGALGHVFPMGYTLGRSLSAVCAAGAAVLLGLAARYEGARWPLALGTAALFVGCYEEGGTFYDLVRIDSLALLLTAGALVVGRRGSTAAAVGSGLLLAFAFSAKHNVALFGLPIALWRWRTHGLRDALTFVAASAGPALAFTVAMQVHTDGLFLTYLLGVPGGHGMVLDRALPMLKNGRVTGAQAELWRALPLVTTVGVAAAWVWARRAGGAYWGAMMAVGLVMVSLMRGHEGGYLNVLIPMFWLLPLLVVLTEGALQGDRGWRAWVPHAVAALLAAQLWEGRGDLNRYIPSPKDRQRAAALVEELRALPGPMLMAHGPWYPVMAGHEPSLSLITLWDIDHRGGPLDRSVGTIDAAMRAGRWATVITPDDKLGHGLLQAYTKAGPVKTPTFGTRTGWGVKFRWIWHPTVTDTASDTP